MSLVYWDTMLFVYLIENKSPFGESVTSVRRRMIERGDRLCTGALTIGELLTGPYLTGDIGLAAIYKAALRPPLVHIIDFDANAAEHYARIRTDKFIGRADAMQLACAATARVDLFLTNDERLNRKVIRGIQFIAGLDNPVL